MPDRLTNDMDRKHYLNDPANWSTWGHIPKNNPEHPLVKIERLTYKSITFFKVCIAEQHSTNWYDHEFHSEKKVIKQFEDHRIYYQLNEEHDAFIRLRGVEDMVKAIRKEDQKP